MPKELNVLFPSKAIEFGEGEVVNVTPLTLEDMPKVMTAFGIVLGMAEKGSGNSEIAVSAAEEILKIVPFCIDRPASEIPSTVVPEIIDAVVELNLTDESVGKWQALVKKVSETKYVKAALGQSEPSKK